MSLRFRSQSVLVTSLGFAISIWWLSIQNYSSMDERSYSRNECQEDLCKIHQDMASFALRRGDLPAAIKSLELAVKYQPDALEPYQLLGNSYERLGDKNNALKTYLAALHIEAAASSVLESPVVVRLAHTTAWQGERLEGKTIMVIAPESLNLTIQFARFLPLLRERGGMVSFQPPRALSRLFSTTHLGINVVNETNDQLRFAVDYYVSLLSLPALLGISYDTMPPANPVIPLPKTLPLALNNALNQTSKIVVGLCLQDNFNPQSHDNKFTAASLFNELANLANIQLVLLDTPSGQNPNIVYAGRYTKTPDGLAAVIKKLDLVIGTESLAIHLAGALDVPAWLLLHQKPSNLWLPIAEQKTSIWYPKMQLFHQPKNGDWLTVFSDVQDALRSMPAKVIHRA